jgi:hypothetical protein
MLKFLSRSSSLYLVLILAAAVLPASLRAQSSPSAAVSLDNAEATGPRALATASWGMHTDAPRIVLPAQSRPNLGKDVAMMAVGGAGIVVGSIIGGDGGMMIAIGGGVIGIIGLYHYLK